MKKLLTVLITLLVFNKSKAQVVFCPPGAEWHYNFESWGSFVNETIKYERDSVIASETLKVLSHTRFYTNCNMTSLSPYLTLIKQKGDTIFFRNMITQQTWQVLCNFSAQQGQGWQTTYTKYDPFNNNPVITNTYSVSSVSSVTVNNVVLKRINIGSTYVTERFGWNGFLFMLSGEPSCDGDLFAVNLCYKDNSFGSHQFTNLPCDYSGLPSTGLPEYHKNNFIKIYPNPTSNFLNLTFENKDGNYEIRLVNILGNEILPQQKIKSTNENFVLDLSTLEKGIYFAQVFEKEKLIGTEKIIKE